MIKLVLQGFGIIFAALMGSALCLGGGYYLSQAVVPHWPPDYHASIAICLLMVVGFGGVGLYAFRSSRR